MLTQPNASQGKSRAVRAETRSSGSNARRARRNSEAERASLPLMPKFSSRTRASASAPGDGGETATFASIDVSAANQSLTWAPRATRSEGTGPRSSTAWARCDSSLENASPAQGLCGSKRVSPVRSSKTRQPALHTSAAGPKGRTPRIPSGQRYSRV